MIQEYLSVTITRLAANGGGRDDTNVSSWKLVPGVFCCSLGVLRLIVKQSQKITRILIF